MTAVHPWGTRGGSWGTPSVGSTLGQRLAGSPSEPKRSREDTRRAIGACTQAVEAELLVPVSVVLDPTLMSLAYRRVPP
jgi:hypothetical protein